MSEVDQLRATEHMSVFSRVEPMHKLKLVELLKAQVRGGRRRPWCGVWCKATHQVMPPD